MNTFLKKLSLFILPIAVIAVLPIAAIFFGREYYSVSEALEIQTKMPKTLFYMAESGHIKLYKSLLIQLRNPEIISLGTSRVMSFREQFFNNPAVFANASNAISSVFDLDMFMEKLPKNNIKIILLGLDQDMFKAGHATLYEKEEVENTYARFGTILADSWLSIYRQYFADKFTVKEIIDASQKSNNIGLNALVNNMGFRKDGSLYQNSTIGGRQIDIKSQIGDTLDLIKKDRSSFFYGTETPPEVLVSLDKFLQTNKEKGVYVIGFLPPYAHALYVEMIQTSDIYAERVHDLGDEIKTIFQKNGFNFYDFSDVTILRAGDEEFIDPKHGTDKMYLRMTLYMTERDLVLQKYVNTDKARLLLKNTTGEYIAE